MIFELFLSVAVFKKMTALIVLDDSPLGADWIILCFRGICFEEDNDWELWVFWKFRRQNISKLWVSDIFVDHGDGFELFLFDVVVAGLEINI